MRQSPAHCTQRMLAEMGRPAFVVSPERRLVVIHLDFFEDDLLLRVEVLFTQGGAKDIAKQLHDRLLELGKHGGVVDRALFAREGVVVGPHLIELPIDIVGAPCGGSLEHHVLEEVAHAGHLVAFVASARLHEESQGSRMRLAVGFRDDVEAVAERSLEEFHVGSVMS